MGVKRKQPYSSCTSFLSNPRGSSFTVSCSAWFTSVLARISTAALPLPPASSNHANQPPLAPKTSTGACTATHTHAEHHWATTVLVPVSLQVTNRLPCACLPHWVAETQCNPAATSSSLTPIESHVTNL